MQNNKFNRVKPPPPEKKKNNKKQNKWKHQTKMKLTTQDRIGGMTWSIVKNYIKIKSS